MKAWVVTVDMGLGHQRATYPLAFLAEGGVITVGSSAAATVQEAKLWKRVRHSYELISRLKGLPLVGDPLFGVMDRLLSIPPYYPVRDLSQPTFPVRLLVSLIERGLCRGMLEKIEGRSLPLITSYLAPAVAADMAGYDAPIYCVICDAEISRAWVAPEPEKSRIHYLAPCERTVMRLRRYGVAEERISLTGFPFPLELLGDRNLSVLRKDLARRLDHLDPSGSFRSMHGGSVANFLGGAGDRSPGERDPGDRSPGGPALTITFAVGGAGAQKEIGATVARSLRDRLKQGRVRLNLVAGVREEVRAFFEQCKEELAPGCANLQIVFGRDKPEYFRNFSQALRRTDVLWTKPSELSFYCGLGIPIILSPTIGSQEVYNREWLLAIRAAIPQEDPRYADQWLFDLLNEGRLAESAWNGFLKVEKYGTYNIEEILRRSCGALGSAHLRRAIA